MKRTIASIAVGLLLAGCGAGSQPIAAPVTKTVTVVRTVTAAAMASVSAVAPVSTFHLTGTFVLQSARGDGNVCTTTEYGYEDIGPTTAVTVYDQAGMVLATGQLNDGTFTSDSHHSITTSVAFAPPASVSGRCTYKVDVADVPSSAKFYQVEIGHRGKITLSAADARTGALSVTL